MQERRKIPRWQINKPASIKLEGAVAFAKCQLKDINFNGLQIALGLKLTVDSYVKFNLKLSEEYSLECEAWVAWHKYIERRNIYGFYFSKLKDSDKDKIYKYVYQNVPEEIAKQLTGNFVVKEGGEDMNDRRIFERIPIHFPARFLNQGSAVEGLADTFDISAKGLGLQTKQALKPQSDLEVWLDVPDKGGPFYTRGQVVWSAPCGLDTYRAGIELEKADLMGISRFLRA